MTKVYKGIHLMIFGLTNAMFADETQRIKRHLAERKEAWKPNCFGASQFDDAVDQMMNKNVDIVYLWNAVGYSIVDMGKGCEKIADAMRRHPDLPVLVPRHQLSFLSTIFRGRRVPVRSEPIEDAVRARWRERRRLFITGTM